MGLLDNYAPINVKPTFPFLGIGGIYTTCCSKDTPQGQLFFTMPLSRRTQYPGAMWRFLYYVMLFEFQYNYKIPTSGEYISDRRHTNPDLCVG